MERKGSNFTTQELIKEAGIALQTFYRYFPAKDYLFLAVIEDVIDENCAVFREEAQKLPDPVDRLRFYVTATVRALEAPGSGPSFITSEHFRLQTSYPAEVSRATQPFTDLLVEQINEAVATGRLSSPDPEYSAWLITQLSMAVFHHYDCAGLDEPIGQIADKVWTFCLAALSGAAPPEASPKATRRSSKSRSGG